MMDRRTALLAAGTAVTLGACAAAGETGEGNMTEADRQTRLSGFALNVESWYLDMPFLERFDRAARSGFTHVEMWGVGGEGREAETIAKTARDAGVNVIQIVGGAPELARVENRAKWLEDCKRTVEAADIIGTDIATIVGHNDVEGISKTDSLTAYRDHMAAAASIFEDAEVFAAIEPFNPYDHPGHFIYGSAEAVEIVRTVNSPFVKLNWDLFHMQRHEGELIGNLKRHDDTICYAQLADTPDRAQPGTGDVNYVNVIQQLRAGGYDKPIGLELWAQDGDYERALADILNLAQQLA